MKRFSILAAWLLLLAPALVLGAVALTLLRHEKERIGRTATPAAEYRAEAIGEGSGLAVVYNADGSLGGRRLLFAMNPADREVSIPLGAWGRLPWRQLADQERCQLDGIDTPFPIDGQVFLPPVGCGLWVLGD